MSLWPNPKQLFAAKKPKASDYDKYLGREIDIPEFMEIDGKRTKTGSERVKINHICGNKFKENFYEINGTHLIGMLRFHAIMEKAKDITEEQMQQFEEMELGAEKLPDAPKEAMNG